MLDRTIEAIPTKYAGVTFRSRLEAKWAEFFTILGIEWEYEPSALSGWVPDFLVAGWWLAEVKPVSLTSMAIVDEPEIQKAIRPYDTLLLGDGPGDALGILVRRLTNGKVFSRYLMADLSQLPPVLWPLPRSLAGYNFGLADIWNGMTRSPSTWQKFENGANTCAEMAARLGSAK